MSVCRWAPLALSALLMLGCVNTVEYKAPPIAPRAEAPALYEPPLAKEYRLQVGDTLSIRSYFDAQLNHDAFVRSDGRISALLIGDMQVSGMTPQELTQRMRDHYKGLIGPTDLVVVVTRSVGMNVYLSGEVKVPSVLPIDGNLTLMQAMARVGGALSSANTGNVLLIRNRDDGSLQVSKIDIEQILRNEAADPYLQQRDVIHVPKSQIAQAGQFVDEYFNAIIPRAIQLQLGWVSTRVTNKTPVVQVGVP